MILILGGCIRSGDIAYFEPSGPGNIHKAVRGVPSQLRIPLGSGSTLGLDTIREKNSTDLLMLVRLDAPVTLQLSSGSIAIRCGSGDERSVSLSNWREWRIRDGKGYYRELPGSSKLHPREYDPKKPSGGDLSVGQYFSKVTLADCPNQQFAVRFDNVLISDREAHLQPITFVPKEDRFTWTVPLQ